MATNRVFAPSNTVEVTASECLPADPTSGTAARWGELTGVAVADHDDARDKVVLETAGTYSLPVKGEDAAGNAAISAGDIVYVDSDGEVNSDATNGARLGIAMAAVASGATTTISVRLG